MGGSTSKVIGDIGSVIGNAVAASFKSVLGRSCENVCGGMWDVVCFIEHVCILDIIRFLLACCLCYICGPGSGKGTQCSNIVQNFGYSQLRAGDLLRAEIKSGSEKGTMIENMIEGNIVPAEVTIKLLRKAIQDSDNEKFMIDGFSRNEENRAAFESITGPLREIVLFFDCSEEEMEKCLLGRNQGREDDNIETIRKGFKVYLESSLLVIEHYNGLGKVRKIDATKPIDAVSVQLFRK